MASKRLPGAVGQDPATRVSLHADCCPGQPGACRAVYSLTPAASGTSSCRPPPTRVPAPGFTTCLHHPVHLSSKMQALPAPGGGAWEKASDAEGTETMRECCVWPGNGWLWTGPWSPGSSRQAGGPLGSGPWAPTAALTSCLSCDLAPPLTLLFISPSEDVCPNALHR